MHYRRHDGKVLNCLLPYRKVIVCILFVGVWSLLLAHGNEAIADQQVNIPKAQAIQIAKQVTGLDQMHGVEIAASEEVLEEDNTPFLHTQIAKRPLWKVSFTHVKLGIATKVGLVFPPCLRMNPYIHAFDIFIDSQTGQVLKIVSPWPSGVPPRRQRTVEELEQRLRDSFQSYEGFPESPPEVTFLQALEIVALKGFAPISETKQIQALYVMHKDAGDKTEPCHEVPCARWLVHLIGFPAIPLISMPREMFVNLPPEQIEHNEHLWHIIDAKVGKLILITSEP